MTLGRVLGPRHRGSGRPRPGPACLPLSRLARPQHCLSDRPVLGPHGQLHFPRRLPAGPPHHLVGSPRAEGARAGTAAPRHSGAVTWAPLGKRLMLKAAPGLPPKGEATCPVAGGLTRPQDRSTVKTNPGIKFSLFLPQSCEPEACAALSREH